MSVSRKYIRDGKVAHIVGCLPSKCEALSSNPSMAKKKKVSILRKKKNFKSLTQLPTLSNWKEQTKF
jgi:hypothetical protein